MGVHQFTYDIPALVSASSDEPEPQIWWQAINSRDRRFDGRFFVAAVTTGIYCRPICPGRFAKRSNLALFAHAAAAEAAGYRPCRRCRPESSPGTPAWLGTSAVVSRALRLIWDGALDSSSVDDFAERMGIGSRQLRRLFIKHLGMPPIKVASTHRVHFARNLIEQTGLSMTDIALNAGFRSLRQFNHAVRTMAGQSPTNLRRGREKSIDSSRPGEFLMRLAYRPPFNWSALMAFLGSRATPGVEVVEESCYKRAVESEGGAGIIEVRPDRESACLIVRIAMPKYRGLLRVVERVRRLFDLAADPRQIAGHLSQHPMLEPLLRKQPGLRVPAVWDGFEVAVRAALGQRLTVVDSSALAGELVRRFGAPVNTSVAGLTHLFPRPEHLAGADLVSIGIGDKCAVSIRALAQAVCKKRLTFESSRTLQETLSRLCAIDGVGEEMAHYIAMRAFEEPDAFPLDCRSLKLWRIAEDWRPWRAYAAMYLWAADQGL